MITTDKLALFGTPEPRAVEQIERCMAHETVLGGALCADNHVGYSMPIGGVIADRRFVSPSGVGFDIGCGNKAVRTDLVYGQIKDDLPRLMDEIFARIAFGVGLSNEQRVDHPVLDAIANADFVPQRSLAQLAANQLGTVGSGNHYVDLFAEVLPADDAGPDGPVEHKIFDDSPVWIGVHFGSRGFGHKTATGFFSIAQGGLFHERASEGSMDAEPTLLDVDSDAGQSYIAAMRLAGEYAYAGRDVVVDKVLSILGARAEHSVHCHHNYAWLETHRGEDVWVVRKGATPIEPGVENFIGASMGGDAAIVTAIEGPELEASLYSTAHGAGRRLSRTQAAGKFKRHRVAGVPRGGEGGFKSIQVKPGVVDWPAVRADLAQRGVHLRGAGADEAPEAYKDLREVLAAHAGSTRIVNQLRPIGVAMAGHDVVDPYKD